MLWLGEDGNKNSTCNVSQSLHALDRMLESDREGGRGLRKNYIHDIFVLCDSGKPFVISFNSTRYSEVKLIANRKKAVYKIVRTV